MERGLTLIPHKCFVFTHMKSRDFPLLRKSRDGRVETAFVSCIFFLSANINAVSDSSHNSGKVLITALQ